MEIPKGFQEVLSARKEKQMEQREVIRGFLKKAVEAAMKRALDTRSITMAYAYVEDDAHKCILYKDITPSDKTWLLEKFQFQVVSCSGYAEVRPEEGLAKELEKVQKVQDAEVFGSVKA